MSLTIQKRFGDALVTMASDKEDIGEAIKELTLLGQLPTTCTNCNKNNVALNHRNAKGFDFFGVRCLSCGAECRLGQYKEGGFFVKDNGKFHVFKGKVTDSEPSSPFGD